MRRATLVLLVAVVGMTGLAPAGHAEPCRPNDGACQPKVCKIRGGGAPSVDPETGTLTMELPYLECYY